MAESDGEMEYVAFAKNHHFQISESGRWQDVRETTVTIGQALQRIMPAIEQVNPETLQGIFGDASWTNKDHLSDDHTL